MKFEIYRKSGFKWIELNKVKLVSIQETYHYIIV